MRNKGAWIVVAIVLVVGLLPLWVWWLDTIIHFGYTGD